METCYRHPDRETAVHCQSCGRPICPACMVSTPVGVRCPECGGRTRMRRPGFLMARDPYVTYLLIAINVATLAFTNKVGGGFGLGGGQLKPFGNELALYGPAVANGQDYRLITAAFVHYGLLHLAVNMYALYLIGGVFERYVGPTRFLVLYMVSALAGSFGALLVTPHAHTVGASGAIFGLMGALFVFERQRGMALLGGSIGGLILINLLITFGIPGISIGGHVGGLVGGGLVAFALSGYGRGHLAYGRLGVLSALGVAAVAVGSLVGALAVAG
ncbi:MAG TPA: rhomboid family intramembrane serine protease [Gaiellales bacterium]|nr:rhomboid family intramembrane serine protease [Gaiellales bacterium]